MKGYLPKRELHCSVAMTVHHACSICSGGSRRVVQCCIYDWAEPFLLLLGLCSNCAAVPFLLLLLLA